MARRLLACALVFLAGLDAALAQRNPDVAIIESCPAVGALVDDSERLAAVLNPVFTTAAEVEAALVERRTLLRCLDSIRFDVVQPSWFGPLRWSLELFVAFAEPAVAGADSVEQVELAYLDDAAVRRLRTDAGLAPPPGLVFIRYFSDRAAMPAVVRAAFDTDETRAVTFGPRYVAILTSGLPPGAARRQALGATYSHEIVHVFLNAGLDWRSGAPRFPGWFHEGMAVHFSGSGRAHVSVGPGGGLVRAGPTAEYEGYERSFRYLEDTLGSAAFHSALRRAVEAVDPGLLLGAVGASDYETLAGEADLWWRWWPVPPAWLGPRGVWWVTGGLFAGLAGLLWLWRRWEPAVAGSSLEVALNRDLLDAVRRGEGWEVRALLRSGADPNARDPSGWTPLVRAVASGDRALAEQLIEFGARVDADVRRATALQDDPAIERVVADAASRRREVW
jgi:hypothetical protein